MHNDSPPPKLSTEQPATSMGLEGQQSNTVPKPHADQQIRKLSRQLTAAERSVVQLKTETYTLQKRRNELIERTSQLSRQLDREKSSRKNEYKARIALEQRLAKEIERANKFKSAYDRLKSHPVLRLARSVTMPVQSLSSSLSQKRASQLEASPVLALEQKPAVAASTSPQPVPAVESIGTLYRRAGKVFEAQELISSLPPDFQPNSSDKVLFDQVSGAARLLETNPLIPSRAHGIGYVPQPGRLMYCAHSTGAFHSNGYSTRTSGLTNALVGLGTDIVVVARPGYPWDAITQQKPKKTTRFESTASGVKTVYNPGTSWSRLALDEYIHEAADIYAREAMIQRPSRIVAASNHVTALPALIAARRLGVPFAYEVRGLWEVTEASGTEGYDQSDRYALAVQLETLIATRADHVFAITTQVRDELVRRGVDESKVSLLPNAADIYEFSPLRPDPALAAKHRLQDGLTIGYAGSVLDYEGLDLVIEALAQLHADGVPAKFVVVGDGPALKGLKELTRELEVSHLVEFIGRVPAKSVPRFIEIFDVVVCPRTSSVVTEMVSPLKPLEAMSAGKTVIGSNVAPLVDLLGTEGTRGVLFNAGDSEDLARVITSLSQDRARREQIGREARQWICQNRSWERIARDQLSGLEHIAVPTADARDKALSDVTIALISDEFTRTSIGSDVTLVMPAPQNWKALLQEEPVDVLLVESAWEGNDGAWHRKVGYYDDEECTDLRELLVYCASKGIPTVFWNKEDPVHFNRFRKTASFFDHVFTTDANCLKDYWAHRGPRMKTMASLPFWAQPALHNPLPTGEERAHSIAYGGSYYGQRFAKRSQELVTLLDAAIPHGLKIYDRQFDNPDSPYRFPEHLEEFVQGGLPYPEMVKAYKNHAVHINVNSVSDSPTMFSRRVFELAGCGTPCISGPGLEHGGIFGATVPSSFTKASVAAKLDRWMSDEYSRLQDAQEAMRIVYRSHLSTHRLAYLLRTAGIPVVAQGLPSYVLRLEGLDLRTAQLVLGQSHPPLAVVTRAVPSAEIRAMFTSHHVEVLDAVPNDPDLFVADFTESFEDPSAAEDLATAIRHTHANTARINTTDFGANSMNLWDWSSDASQAGDMRRVGHEQDPAISVLQLPARTQVDKVPDPLFSLREGEPRNVLIAGHDLKFAGKIIEGLKSAGHNVTVDQWTGHSQHDEAKSRELLVDADAIFCEWSLGNLAWYSKNKLPDQRLVSRFHFQEIITKYPAEVDYTNVDELIFVGEYLRRTAINKFGIPEELTKVVFNTVDVTGLDRPKTAEARFNLGLVGMVPEHKRLDVALDLVAKLRSTDSRYHLYVKGNRPEEYPWMAARPQEMKFYEEQYARIETDPLLRDGVTFDGHGSDMQQWYQKIGVSLSVSDFESFHYTIADGAASGAIPVGLAWAGADQIYPAHWLANSVEDMAERILDITATESMFRASGVDAQNVANAAFPKEYTEDVLIAEIVG